MGLTSILGELPRVPKVITADVIRGLAVRNGKGTYSVAIPSAPSLIGRSLFSQGVVSDPGANALGLLASQALESVVGVR